MKNLKNSLCLIIICMTLIILVSVNAFAKEKKTLMSFPIDNSAGAENSQVSKDISARINEIVASDSDYTVIVYTPRILSVQRLVITNPQKKISLTGPFSLTPKALDSAYEIASATGASTALVGSIDKCIVNDNQEYEVAVTVMLLDVKKKSVLQTIVAFGNSPLETGSMRHASLIAADKVIEQITNKKPSQAIPLENKPIKKGSSAIIMNFSYSISDDADVNLRFKQAAKMLQTYITNDLKSNSIFNIINYSNNTPSVARAIREKKISSNDISNFTELTKAGSSKAINLAKILSASSAIIGSIDSIKMDENKAEIIATIQIIDIAAGSIESMITVRGTYTGTSDESEKAIIEKAAIDASTKIIEQLKNPSEKN